MSRWKPLSFDDRYLPEPNSGCWLWEGSVSKRGQGYGQLTIQGRTQGAHRFSWEVHHGEIPAGMFVLHTCDTPSCINPDHLYLGTHQDNVDDKVRKNRSWRPTGTIHPSAKLTEDDVRAIRADTRSQNAIAKDYGIIQVTVSDIKRRKIWKHI